jgi:hypothetical protein
MGCLNYRIGKNLVKSKENGINIIHPNAKESLNIKTMMMCLKPQCYSIFISSHEQCVLFSVLKDPEHNWFPRYCIIDEEILHEHMSLTGQDDIFYHFDL